MGNKELSFESVVNLETLVDYLNEGHKVSYLELVNKFPCVLGIELDILNNTANINNIYDTVHQLGLKELMWKLHHKFINFTLEQNSMGTNLIDIKLKSTRFKSETSKLVISYTDLDYVVKQAHQ